MALDFFAGCVGGCAGVLVGHPFDTVKVKIQTQDFRNPTYRGTWHCFSTIIKTESVRGLYRGVTSPMGGVSLVNAIVFGVYGNVQRSLAKSDNDLASHFYSGAAAGICQSLVCSPMELAKTRLQVQKTALYRGTVDCLLKVWRAEGRRGVFKGLGVTVAREIPAFGTYFYTYELLMRQTGSGVPSTGAMLLAGGLAGTASWIVSYPVDVVKSRLQSDGMEGTAKYKNALDCFLKSVRVEGPGSMFRGLNSTLIRAFPANAVTFAAVTWVFRLAQQPEEGSAPTQQPSQPITVKLKENIKQALQYYEDERVDVC